MTPFDKSNENKKENFHVGHRNRLYQTLLACNFDPILPHIMLEYLLFQVYPMCDTNPIAHRLINKFGNFCNVFDAKHEDLMKVNGVGDKAAQKILSYKRFANYYNKHKTTLKVKLAGPIDFVNYFGEKIRKSDHENLIVIAMNDQHEVKNYEIFEGSKDHEISFDIRDIYEVARKCDCYKIVLMHNHPGGDAQPSPADLTNTKQLYAQMINLRVEIADHIIVSEHSFYSMDRNNNLDEVRKYYGIINMKTHQIDKK